MLNTISNKSLRCKISSKGAELRSLINNRTGKEYIWQIDESVWGSSSPVLFPAIGKIKSGKITYHGKAYDMPKHGIIRYNTDLKLNHFNDSHCSFKLESSPKTLTQYPYQFSFEVDYKLIDYRLIMTYYIKNNSNVKMPFMCGGHTAYACPLDHQTKLTDYSIDFPKSIDFKARTLGDSGLLSHRIRKIPADANCLELSEALFDEDALIFENIDFDWVRLRRKDNKKGIVVKFTGYHHLALWAKPGADYVCIEPWLGLPDSEEEPIEITKKSTYKHLKPGESFSIAIETLIE